MNCATLTLTERDSTLLQEAYHALCANLLFSNQECTVIAVTSCEKGEGKTTVCLNLAKNLAELGKRVLVMDADLRSSVMADRNASLSAAVGLSELLNGQCSLDDCLYTTQHQKLQLLFAGKRPPNPMELLNGNRFRVLMTELRNQYDYVLVDTPPFGAMFDAAVIAAHCDGAILVIGDRSVGRKRAQAVVAQLEKCCKLLGVVRNHTGKGRNFRAGAAHLAD
ncbi:MAG: CpsD/CapB family tyrosine-protein kinase [Clostridiales bacterium]|nr:CpsD/CapB family tyrosine-protein kinase [Clostridiales bacterium]